MLQTYRHSGAVTFQGVLYAAALGALVAILGGIAYTFCIVYIPVVYINLLLTMALGAGVGLVAGLGAKWGKIRNIFATMALGTLLGALALYMAWAADPWARLPSDLDPNVAFLKDFHLDPQVLWIYMQIFYEEGLWGMSDNTPVSGIPLAIVWIIEAGVILFCAAVVAKFALGDTPFCERCQEWTRNEEDLRRLLINDGQLIERLAEGQLAALAEFPLAPADAVAYLKLDLATCGGCAESNFLRASVVSTTVDKKGNLQTVVATLIPYAHISPEEIPLVRGAGREMTAAEQAAWAGETEEVAQEASDADREPSQDAAG